MEYTSFYGGRKGSSFVIVKSFASIAEMVAAFAQGGAYKTVGYDEYVIIDTIDKNDIDNGKIYCRGYDYNNEVGGAIYIGQIVGPDGAAPQVEMKTYQEVQDIYSEHGPVDPDTGDEYRKTEGEYAPTENLIPGTYIENDTRKYNDSIKWVACSIKDEHSNASTVHVGFIIPYMVVDYTAQSVDPYYHRSNETETFDNEDLVTREDDAQHPYYERWHLNVPKGIKGDTFKNLRVIPAEEVIQDYEGKEDDIANGRSVVVYDYYHYDKQEDGEPVTIYLGDYNQIDNVELDEEGTLTFQYSHDDDQVFNKAFKWVKEVALDIETGHFAIKFNHDTDKDNHPTIYETDLRWVKDIQFQENGSVNLVYTSNTDEGLEYDRLIKWIKSVTIDENGHIVVLYNYDTDTSGNPTKYEADLRYVNNIEVAQNGTITLKYTTGVDTVLDNKIKWITSTSLAADGTLSITYNDNSVDTFAQQIRWIDNITFTDAGHLTITYNNGTPSLEKDILWLTDVVINTGDVEGEGNQKVKLTFNNGVEKEIGVPLNYIMKVAIDDRYHLLVLYSDPARRQEIKNFGRNATWQSRDDWYDLGYIGNGQTGAVAGKESDATVTAIADSLPPYSVWFIVEEDQ